MGTEATVGALVRHMAVFCAGEFEEIGANMPSGGDMCEFSGFDGRPKKLQEIVASANQ